MPACHKELSSATGSTVPPQLTQAQDDNRGRSWSKGTSREPLILLLTTQRLASQSDGSIQHMCQKWRGVLVPRVRATLQIWDSELLSRARLKQWTSQQSKESEAHQTSVPRLRKLCWLR